MTLSFTRQYEAMSAIFANDLPKCFNDDTTSWCCIHQKKCRIYDTDSGIEKKCALQLGWAGTSCLDVCRPGKRLGRFGPTSKAFKTWCQERLVRQENLYIQESTELFDKQSILDEVGNMYDVFCLLLGPELFGWWTSRPRHFCVLVLKASGSLATCSLDSFLQIFCRARPVDGLKGHAFWCAPAGTLEAMRSRLAEKRRVHMTAAFTSWRSLLSLADQARLRKYDSALETKRLTELAAQIADEGQSGSSLHGRTYDKEDLLSEKLICNPRQNEGCKMGSLTAFVPTLLRKSVIWSQEVDRFLIGKEHLVVQGVPAFAPEPGFEGRFIPPWAESMDQFDDDTLKEFAGNSIHSLVAGALTCWVLCNYVPHSSSLLIRAPSYLFRGQSTDFEHLDVHSSPAKRGLPKESDAQDEEQEASSEPSATRPCRVTRNTD